MRAPAAVATVPFILGIVAGVGPPSVVLLGLALVLFGLTAFAAHHRRRFGATVLLLAGFFLLGVLSRQLARHAVERQSLLQRYESLSAARLGTPCRLTGVLREEPWTAADTVRMRMDVETWKLRGAGQPISGTLRVTVRGGPEGRRSLIELDAGDRIALWVTLRRSRGFLNPGGFAVDDYLARSGALLSGSVKSALLVERLSPARRWSPARLGSRVRRFVRRRLQGALEGKGGDEVPGVAIALLIGDRTFLPVWAERLYQESGVFHVVVISGAHVALLAALIYGMLRWLGLDRNPSLLVLLCTLPAYAALCGGRPSIVRAVTMCMCVVGARLLSLDAPALNGLACSALVLLAARPMDVDDPGFQLSFAATTEILLLAGPLARGLVERFRWPTYLAHALAISLSAQAAVIPLLAYHFQRLTLGAVPASIVAMPLAAAALAASGLLALFAPVPWLGEALASCVGFLVGALTACARFTVDLPAASLRVSDPSWWWLVGYGLLLVTVSIARGHVRLTAALLLCLAILWLPFQFSPMRFRGLRLTALDVGHGDSLLLELPDGRNILVDGGGSFDRSFDMGENVVVPALLHQGVRRLHAVVLTHADFDHLGGLTAVVSNLAVGEIWEGRPAWDVADYRRLREVAELHGVPVRGLRAGEEMELGEVQLEVLAAGLSEHARAPRASRNDDSLVLRVCYVGSCLLLTGDAERTLELDLIRSGRNLRADFLKVAHHGSRSSTSAAFLEAVQPRVAIVSTGSGNVYLPSTRVLHRLRRRGVTSLRTDLDGAIRVEWDRRGVVRIETFRTPR